jgi:glyoxylase-like metal-dependent hydrolase (beta-lactamase superfamily II)
MRFCKTELFDSHIRGIRLGWSIVGPPFMTVYCYVFDHIMIDTGLSHMEKEVVNIARESGVKQIFLTHYHEDHSGNAAAIHKALCADVYSNRLTAQKLKKPYPIMPYQKYAWGKTTPVRAKVFPEETDTGSDKIVPVHTPGHAKDHTVFFLPKKGILFSGDLYLADRIKFFRSDEDIGTEIESLKTVVKLDFDTLLCGHYPREKNGKYHIRTKLEFLENFYGSIINLWKKGFTEKRIFNELRLKEAYFVKYFCCGNVSMLNGVRSVIRHFESKFP